jgi:Tol biopolymer transport system component
MIKTVCASSAAFLLLFVAVSTSAQVVRQVTDEKTVSFGTAAMDDSGQTVWIGSTADPDGDNPGHAFRLVAIDPTTAVPTTVSSLDGGISPLLSVTDDGQWIVFVSPADPFGTNLDHGPELFVVAEDGTGLAQLTSEPAPDGGSVSQVLIAGGGNPVLFVANTDPLGTNAANSAQLFSIQRDGTALTQLTTFVDDSLSSISVSDDGLRIVLVHNGDPLATNPDLGPELFAIDGDGMNLRQLTTTPDTFNTGSTTISGDGSTIAFTSNADLTGGNLVNRTEIFAIDWDGTSLRQVTTTTALLSFTGEPSADGPSIVDDGSRIFYYSNFSSIFVNLDSNFEVFSIGSNGTGRSQITSSLLDVGSVLPVVSGDGSRVAYLDISNQVGLVTETVPGGTTLELSSTDVRLISAADLSSDRSKAVFVRSAGLFDGAQVWKVDGDGSGLAQLTSLTSGGASAPSVAGDGQTIVFSANSDPLGLNSDVSDEIFRINVDGSGLQQLTSFPAGASASAASFSDDATKIVFEGDVDPGGLNADGSTELFVMNADGSALSQLTDGPLATTSRRANIDQAGLWIVFESNADFDGGNLDGSYEVWRVQAGGTGLERLTGDPVFSSSNPDLSADGSLIVYRSAADPLGTNPENNQELFLYRPATAAFQQLTAFAEGNVSAPALDRSGTWVYFSTSAPIFEDDPDRPSELYRLPVGGGAIERVGALTAGSFGSTALGSGDAVAFLEGLGDPTGGNADQLPELWLIDRETAPTIEVSAASPTIVRWPVPSGPKRFDVIRGNVAQLSLLPDLSVDLGAVACLENDSPDNDTEVAPDILEPPPGQVFFFLFRGSQGILDGPGSYGLGTAGGERNASAGDCSQ